MRDEAERKGESEALGIGARRCRGAGGVKLAVLVSLVAAAAAAAILLNLALLGYAQPKNDPAGKLSPRAVLTPAPTPPGPPAAVTVTTSDHREQDD